MPLGESDQPLAAAVRFELALFLGVGRYATDTAGTLEEASSVAQDDRPFDLAIVDVMLGEESGYDLAAELVSRSGEYLPVLLVTAGEIDREKGFAAGADAGRRPRPRSASPPSARRGRQPAGASVAQGSTCRSQRW